MKTKFARILGVGVTLALLASLLISAIPAAAISQPQVALTSGPGGPTVDPAYVISKVNDYTITFTAGVAVPTNGRILITFPSDTNATTITSVDLQVLTGIGGGPVGPVTGHTFTPPASTTVPQTLIIPLVGTESIGAGSLCGVTVHGITNPTSAGSYTLTVATDNGATTPVTIEAAVTSATYTIVIPTIPPLAGIVSVYNPTGVLMAQYIGDAAITSALAVTGTPGWSVQIGPGTYLTDVNIAVADVVVKGTGATADLVVIKPSAGVLINANKVTLDNLTIDTTSASAAVGGAGTNFTIKNCAFKNGTGNTQLTVANAIDYVTNFPGTIDTCTFAVTGNVAVGVAATVATTVKNSTFSVDAGGTAIAGTDVTIDTCTITGASGTGVSVLAGTSTVKNSTFKTLTTAISDNATVTVSGSTIEGCGSSTAGSGDAIEVTASGTLRMYGNTIKDSASANYALDVASGGVVAAWFNNITGNTKNVNGTVDARHNWWGAATGPAAGSTGTGVTTHPVAGASISAASVAWTEDILDASTTVGIIVTAIDDNAPINVDAIAVAKYSGNPQVTAAPMFGTGSVLGYYDVFYCDTATTTGTADTLQIKFTGAVSTYTKVYYGGALSGAWVEPTSYGVNVAGGYAWVSITGITSPNLVDLTGTPFVVVEDKTTAPPSLGTPEVGQYGVPIAPTYTWSAVPGAIRYEIALAEDPTFSIVEWSYNVTNNFYKDTEELKYKTTYYWRVRGVLAEPYLDGKAWVTPSTPWAVGIFTTEAEPPPPEEPQEIVVPPADVTVEIPPTKITVEQPGPFIPEYLLWVIVGIGAVLLIALIVLIVRTRRVV